MREESIRVGEGASILSGYPFSSDGFSTERGLPLIRIRDISSRQTEIRFDGAYDDDFVVEPGDVLIGMDGDFIASKWVGEPGLLNQRVLKISADADSLDQGYLYHWLQPKLDEIHRRTPQTTVRHLSIKDVRAIELPNFPLPEQRRIARVLDTVDAAIRQTEAVIAKLKQVKAGLLHDLLTRGLDENGELRDPVRHPEQFKDSPLGRVPKEWEVVRCGDAFTMSSGKSRPKSVGQLPVYGGNGVSGYSNRALIGHSTLVVGRVGEYCGSVHITDGPAWITDNALYIREIELILDVHYLARFLTW